MLDIPQLLILYWFESVLDLDPTLNFGNHKKLGYFEIIGLNHLSTVPYSSVGRSVVDTTIRIMGSISLRCTRFP
jgi:hypothetical protein